MKNQFLYTGFSKIVIMICCAVLLFTSCEDTNMKKAPCEDYFIYAKINGSENFYSNILNTTDTNLNYHQISIRQCDLLFNQLILSFPQPIQTGSYPFTSTSKDSVNIDQSAFAEFMYNGKIYTTQPDSEGELIITEWNENEKIISGTFSFKAYHGTNQLTISSGEFNDIKID
jgi:hypothetical protein